MQYRNDETDRELRKRNYYLLVYVFPVIMNGFLAALIYYLAKDGYIKKQESYFGYFFIALETISLHFNLKSKWLKLPDSNFIHIKSIPYEKSLLEPTDYVAEYYAKKTDKYIAVIYPLFVIAMGIFFYFSDIYNGYKIIFIFSILFGIYLFVINIKLILEKGPRLKIAKNGVWTKKIGFVTWDKINSANVKIENGRNTIYTVEIYLKGTLFEQVNKPDELLPITDIKERDEIKKILESMQSNYKSNS